jgi:hypothetical protein
VKIGNVPIDVEIGGQALPCGYQKVRLCNIGDEDLCVSIFLFLNRVASHAKRHLAHNSKPPKSVREAPHSKFVCSLYIGKIGHTYLSIPFNIGRWSRVGDHFRHQIVRLVFAGRSLLPSKTLLRCGCLSHLMMAQRETYKVKLTELQAELVCRRS